MNAQPLDFPAKIAALIALALGVVSFPFTTPCWPEIAASVGAGVIAAAIIGLDRKEMKHERTTIALLVMTFIQLFAHEIWKKPHSGGWTWENSSYAAQSSAALGFGFVLCRFLIVRFHSEKNG